MDIAFVSRSRFLTDCAEAVREKRDQLERGELIRIPLPEGGYPGRVTITIDQADQNYFATDWEGSDPTRFPVRIRAAATALLLVGYEGSFELAHRDGSLEVRRIGRA